MTDPDIALQLALKQLENGTPAAWASYDPADIGKAVAELYIAILKGISSSGS